MKGGNLIMKDSKMENQLPVTLAFPEKELQEAEKDLEEELQRDTYIPPKANKWARFRHRGELLLHTKHVLMMVVILNLVDCVLVLSELILDIHYVKVVHDEMDSKTQLFIDEMQSRYPDRLTGYSIDSVDLLYSEVYKADCYWTDDDDDDDNDDNDNGKKNRTRRSAEVVRLERLRDDLLRKLGHAERYRREAIVDENGNIIVQKPHGILIDLAHAFHKASIAILGILFVENILKVVFSGWHFFKRKLEVFDAIVVAISFTVDLVLLKGLTEFEVQLALFILSFLLPWRVIRLVNSLIVAVLDHEHFRLKMMYKEKKVLASQVAMYKDMKKNWENHLQKIEDFCESEGIPKWKIRQHTALQRRQSIVTSMASLALNSVLQNLHVGFNDNRRLSSQISSKASSTEDLSTVSKNTVGQGVVNQAFQGDTTPSATKDTPSISNGTPTISNGTPTISNATPTISNGHAVQTNSPNVENGTLNRSNGTANGNVGKNNASVTIDNETKGSFSTHIQVKHNKP